MELVCAVQEYAWGKQGLDSQVARLAPQACPPFTAAAETPYAELWMGTHPNGPARLAGTGQLLGEYIGQNPACLGQKVRSRFGDQLPYLFKVLSVGKALSIQAHPDKPHAEELHRDRPDVYKDPNHKPEIAIALTEFEGLCGFRPLAEIQAFLHSVPELAAAVGPVATAALTAATETDYTGPLREAFTALMRCDKQELGLHLAALTSRLGTCPGDDSLCELFQRLHGQYRGDVGCFVIYFLNVLRLAPGEAMFLGPNVPHAYLSGDCIECMANSDNVVRAGLTPKLIDTPTLVAMLDYSCSAAESRKFAPVDGDTPGCLEFDPPVPDFAVARHQAEGGGRHRMQARDSASLVLVTEGRGRREVEGEAGSALAPGSVLFLPAGQEMYLLPEAASPMVAFQAHCSL